jgi:Zn-dependent protease with chaperone function
MEEGLAALFVTHPKTEERVRRLRALDTTKEAA